MTKTCGNRLPAFRRGTEVGFHCEQGDITADMMNEIVKKTEELLKK